MATTSSTTKAKPDYQNLSRTRSLGRKPKLPSSVSLEDGSDHKPEKPLPNYLKPTISSRREPVKFLKKNNNSLDDDNQKLLRRRSFDRPPSSSLTSPSTSAQRIPKSLNVSPSRSRDRPTVPREKPVIGLRSSSFHGSRGGPRGGNTVKSSLVAPKKNGLGSSSNSLKSKKEGYANVKATKASDNREITLDSASLSSAHEDAEETPKVDESDGKFSDDIEEPNDEKENKDEQVEVVQADESGEENESSRLASSAEEDCIAVSKEDDEEEEELINEEKIEETEEQEYNQDNKSEEYEEVKNKIDEDETHEKVDIDMQEVENVRKHTEENEEEEEEVAEEKEVKEEEIEEKESKTEVVKGKKESPSAYNDVIASKMQENPKKNKVLALAGAFQTVIDYETAASK